MGNLIGNITEVLSTINLSDLFKPQEYLDPGTGSFLIQILLASLVGIGFAFRTYWGKLLRKITGKTEDIDDDYDDDDDEE
jgi:hypothetical protein